MVERRGLAWFPGFCMGSPLRVLYIRYVCKVGRIAWEKSKRAITLFNGDSGIRFALSLSSQACDVLKVPTVSVKNEI